MIRILHYFAFVQHFDSVLQASVRNKKLLPRLFLLLWIVGATELSVVCQDVNPQSAVDNLTRSSMHVDVSTGALQFQIPLGDYRGRGEAGLPVVLHYSSKLWNIKYMSTQPCGGEPVASYMVEYAKSSASGWTSSLGWFLPTEDASTESYEGQTQKPATVGNPNLFRIMRKYVTLPDGSRHELRRDEGLHSFAEYQSGVYYAVDGSRMWWDWTDPSNNTLFLPNGSRIVTTSGTRQYVDRNGNVLTYNSSTLTWSDTLGRSIGVPIGGTPPAAGDYTYTLPGGLTYTLRWRNLGNALTDPTQPLHYKGDMLSANCTLGNAQPNALFSTVDYQRKILQGVLFNPVVLWQIELPNVTSKYTFTYNVYGEITKVVYPTGGSETFAYDVWEPLSGQLDDGTLAQANRGVLYRTVSDGVNPAQIWSYNGNVFETGVDPATAAKSFTGPDGTRTVTWYYKSRGPEIKYGFDDARTGMTREVRVFNSSGVMLRRTVMQLAMDGPLPGGYSTATRNARVTKTVEIILDTGGNALAAATEMTYDADLNVTITKQYDYVSISQTTGQTGDIPSIPNGTLLRTSETDYLTNNPSYRARNLLALPTATRAKNGAGTIVAQSSISYDEAGYPLLPCGASTWIDPATTARGNATTSGSWLNTTGTYLQSHAQYDQCGSVRYSWDAKGNQSQVQYSSTYAYAYPTYTQTAVPDPSGQYGSTTALVATSLYDFNTGLLTSSTDANNKTTSYTYDSLTRIRTVTKPDGGLVTYNYGDTPGSLYVQALTKQNATQDIDAYQFFDGLGRANRSFLSVGSGNYITADTQYDSMGRAQRVSNPYLSTGSASAINPLGYWTATAYDALGRALSVTTPDAAVVTSSYSGNTVTVTDQSLKKRKSVTDALGRLKEVYEDPTGLNYLTSYTYDPLDDLTSVTQSTQLPRNFVYDSLKRLTSAFNPESGTVNYQYDNNGNLTRKTDARGIYIDYLYDALNRNTTINYSDTTTINPDITRIYDGAINGKGRLWVSYAGGNFTTGGTVEQTAIDNYDSLGRPLMQRQTFKVNGTWGPGFQTLRTYDLAGHVITQTYPSGRTVSYSYDIAGRTSSFSGNLGDGVPRTYTANTAYDQAGRLKEEQFGTQVPLYHKLHYNVRGQLNDIRLSTVAWATDQWNWNRGALVNYYATADISCQTNECFFNSGPDNNGNLIRAEHWIPANDQMSSYNFTQDRYLYDSLNRLDSIAEYHGSPSGLSGQDLKQAYVYDRYGNRTINQTLTVGAPKPNFGVDPATNRLTAPAGYTMSYDNAGNLTNDTYTGQGQRTYDAENHMTQAWANSQWQVYTYNAHGQRTRRKVNGVETWQVYGMDGELLGEYASSAAPFVATKEYGYRNGELVVTVSSGDDQRLKRFVQYLYYGALQRDPTTQELQDKTTQLAAAGAQSQSQLLTTASQIARSLFTSTNYETSPYRSDIQYVTDLYYAYLQRGPDDSGLGYWAGQAAGSRVNVCNAFEASGEFQTLVATLYGNSTSDNQRTEQLVNNFYLGAYGRNATSTELQQQRDALNTAAAQGLTQVQAQAETFGRSLFTGQVNDAGLSNTQFVTNLYEAFLQRGPDAGGLSFWAGQASVGQGRQNVLGAFATSTAFRELSGALYREAFWLMADHLGTPRMIVDKSGNLSSVKRHDYLPFGEELLALTGGRTTTQGYTSDSVRQKFTRQERDNETGLDYFIARSYSSTQGRFASPDSFAGSGLDPQTLNRYAYVMNNPLRFTDPTGHYAMPRDHRSLDDWFKLFKSQPFDLKPKLPMGLCGACGGQTPAPPPQNPATVLGPNGEVPGDEAVLVIDSTPAFPGNPKDAPGDTLPERAVSSPVHTALEVADWASKGVRRFGYAIAPDYGYVGFSLPLMAGGNLQFSKDRHLYGSYNFFGYSGGNYNAENLKNWKAGFQFGAAYFWNRVDERQRDEAIRGPGFNATTGPIGGYFPVSGGPPAVTVGWPFTNLGVNVSHTKKIF